MQHLWIEQKGPHGTIKSWRLRQEQSFFSFGTSKHADLRSPEIGIKGIQGLFEWRASEAQWFYVNLDLHQGNTDEPIEHSISQAREIRIGTSVLQVTPYEPRAMLFTEESSFRTPHLTTDASARAVESLTSDKASSERRAYQLFLVYHGKRLLETELLPIHQNFVSRFDPSHTSLAPQDTSSWVRIPIGDLEISQRRVHLTSSEALALISRDQVLDPSSRSIWISCALGAVALSLLFLISPSSRDAREVAFDNTPPPIQEARVVLPKQKAPASVAQPPSSTALKSQNKQRQTSSLQTDRISAIRSISNSRISQLIGKVSASAAKSKNLVLSSGVEAGTAESGSALAALGKINKEGKDWNSESQSKKIQVSTIGSSGNLGKIGALKAGTTGLGGAELLEEESEITGGLDREVIANYIKSQLGQILYCYERQLSAEPQLYGKVTVKFTIGPSGAIETQRVSETSLRSPIVEACMLQRISKWKFPSPEGGTRVVVSYPFLFKSTN